MHNSTASRPNQKHSLNQFCEIQKKELQPPLYLCASQDKGLHEYLQHDDDEYLDDYAEEEDEVEDSESDYLKEDLWDDGDGWNYDDEMEWIDE